MQEIEGSRVHPVLKELVAEASRALALLDADRLEELALSCQALNREMVVTDPAARGALALQARHGATEMAVFARVLDATRANLNVMRRLRDLREGKLEYGAGQFGVWTAAESGHGDN